MKKVLYTLSEISISFFYQRLQTLKFKDTCRKMAGSDKEHLFEREKSPDDRPHSPTLLPWDKFSNWLYCACVVTFDLELGQAMEV